MLLLSSSLSAQLTIRSGVLLSKLSFDESLSTDNDNYIGWQANIGYNLKINNHIFILAGANYARRGGAFTRLGIENKIRLSYLDVPVLLKYNPYSGPIFFQVGPQFSFLLSANHTRKEEPEGEEGHYFKHDEFQDFDIGLAAGMGIYFGYNLLAELRFTKGFQNVIREDRTSFSESSNQSRSGVWAILLGYYF